MIVLIAGAPGTGTASVAKALAQRLSFPVQSMDELARGSQEHAVRAERQAGVYKRTPEQLQAMFLASGEALMHLLHAQLQSTLESRKNLILEGPGIHPAVARPYRLSDVKAAFLIEVERKEVQEELVRPGLSTMELSNLGEASVLYSRWLRDQCVKQGQPCLPCRPRATLPERVARELGL